ncbi:MAG: hypothetical protein AABY22_17345 [Nanoarchaeota archaeon]
MGIFKSFLSASTTLQSGKYTNTAQNPVTEFTFGGVSNSANTHYNRFIFKIDHSKILAKYKSKDIMSGSVTSHKLKLVNTGSFDNRALLSDSKFVNRERGFSYDLVLFKIPTGTTYSWDQGRGYDFDYSSKNTDFGLTGKKTESPANWFERKINQSWPIAGIYSANTPLDKLGEQHFELGNENIEFDVTEEFQKQITGETSPNGWGIALSGVQETATGSTEYATGYFTDKTNTIWVPVIESSFSGFVKDDRKNFYIDKTNRLFLYTNKGKDPVNLDSIPSQVSIYDETDNIFSAITGTKVNQLSKGIYYVDVLVPNSGNTILDLIMYKDIWSGITIDKISLPAIEMDFVLKKSNLYYNFGNNSEEPTKYGFSFYGIKRGERIKKGDIRKLFVIAKKEFNPEDDIIIDGLQYRLYINQGRNQIDIIPWTDVNRTFNNNYLTLDTSWLLQHTYFLQLKLKSNNTEIVLDEPLNFIIVENL